MKHETALAAALQACGVRQEDVDFDIAIARYLNSGGTIERALALLNVAAARMSCEGLDRRAIDVGLHHVAQTRQQVEDEIGRDGCALKEAVSKVPISHSFNRGGDGLSVLATLRHTAPAIPVREPPKPVKPNAPRGLTSIVSATQPIKRGFLIMHKTSDGRPWGKVHWYELDGMKRDGAVAQLVKHRFPRPADPDAKLDEILTDAQFAEIYHASQKQVASF